MERTIVAPTVIEQPMYSGKMAVDVERLKRQLGDSDRLDMLETPEVTIAEPICWSLPELMWAKGQALPAEMETLMSEARFYLLQLSFSFDPDGARHVTQARFGASMQSIPASLGDPIAFSVYPEHVRNQNEVRLKVGIGPGIKIGPLELALADIFKEIVYERLEPVVDAHRVRQPNPCWDFRPFGGTPLVGTRTVYVIVRAPLDANGVRLLLDISAQVTSRLGRFVAGIFPGIGEPARGALARNVCVGKG